jgi:hypothetical protein
MLLSLANWVHEETSDLMNESDHSLQFPTPT